MARRLALLIAGFLALAPPSASAFPDPTPAPATHATVPRELIVRFRADATDWQREALRQRMNGRVKWQFRRPDVQLIELESGAPEDVVLQLADEPLIEYVEPNYRVQMLRIPNDPRFTEQWALRNIGQTGGTIGADIRAAAAWDVSTGDPAMRIGVIDTGVDYTHPDLADNIWTNPGEIAANGADDDGNGYVDDVHGFDVVNFDGNPLDDNGHGTFVSGVIAGRGNNGVGIAGINWRAQIVAIKFLDASGFGTNAGAIAAIEYSIAIGLEITNNSWGGGPPSAAVLDAINDAGAAGQLFVAAAGNDFGNDNDQNPVYPASYPAGNIISVAATNHFDQLAVFSNYGPTTVDLAAPGEAILSTHLFSSYIVASGTSAASPYVAGALGLLWGQRPELSAAQARARLLAGVDPLPGLAGVVATGGRLNALFAISDPDSIAPGAISSLSVLGATSNTAILTWIAPGDDGETGRASSYEVRYSTAPITESNFVFATLFPAPDPRPAGAPDSVEVTGLPFLTTHYFALRAFDEFSNPGPISNVVSGTTLGTPDLSHSPTSVSATLTASSEVRTLTLANVGEGTLDFSIPAPAQVLSPMAQHPHLEVAKGAVDPRPRIPVVADQGGPDSFGYRWVDSDEPGGPEFEWVDITTSGTETSLTGDENVTASIPIGFPFSFYGNRFDSVSVGVNGWLSFTDTRAPTYNIQPLPSASPYAPANLVAPFWTDLLISGSGRVYVRSDDHQFIVSWIGVSHYFLPATYTFQVLLSRSGDIRFQYHTISGPDSLASALTSIGIQNAARNIGLNVSFLDDYARPGLAVRILPPPEWLSVAPRSGRIPAGSSQIVNLTLDATELIGGAYRSDLHLTSNDPDESDVVVPVQLVSVGVPEIDLPATTLDFGSLLTGGTVRETLWVLNPGTDTLRVSSITSDHPAFVPFASSMIVPPLGQRRLFVNFTPMANGPAAGALTLLSNDADEGVRTVAMSGVGLPPPDIAVTPESLFVGVDVGSTASRTLRVSNPGESDLHVVVKPIEAPAEGGGLPVGRMPLRLPVDPAPGGPPPTPPGPEANLLPRTQPTVPLAGLYSGSRMTFGITDYGEVMPFQFPTGNEHLAAGAWVSGYTVGLISVVGPDSTIQVYTSGHEFRNGIVPESFQELEVSPNRVLVRVTTRTSDNFIRIIREITFQRDDQFVHVATRLENLTLGSFAGVVFKEFADWDIDNDPGDDTWNYDRDRNLVLASDSNLAGLVAGTTPQVLDLYGWDDFGAYQTIVNYPSGPVVFLDGLAVLHFELGTIGGGGWGVVTAAYCAGSSLADLQAVADRATSGVSWLSAEPDTFTVSPGSFADVVLGFDASDLFGGDHRAIIRLTSNDPNEGEFDVPVLLRVTGIPELTVFPSALAFDSTFVGSIRVESLLVTNPGTDSLRVTSIASAQPAFVASPSTFVVGPHGSQNVEVRFAPISVGMAATPLVFASNDPDQPAFEVPLQGVGLDPPIAGAAPDSFLVGLFTGETRLRQMFLSNSGGSVLRANIEAVSTGTPDSVILSALPIALAMADPHAGIALDDWQARARASRPILLATPPRRAIPTSSLPVVIEDPIGDGSPLDLSRLRGGIVMGELRVALEFECCVDLLDFGGYVSLDLDQDPSTGEPPYYGAPGHDIGQDVVVTLFSAASGYVDAYQTPGAYLGAFPVAFDPQGFSFAIPLSVLGSEGSVDVSGVIGTSLGPTDWFPDTGHGTISGASWVVVSPAEVAVLPGETVALNTLFNAAGLNGGEYSADITIHTNDPGPGATLIVPARLLVTGAPDIAVTTPALDFGDLFLGASTAESLVVTNEGTDVLVVTSIGSTDPAFSASVSSFALDPGGSALVMVSFSPSSAVTYAAGLEIHSNDADEPVLGVALAGRGLIPPVIEVAPESLYVGLMTNESRTRTLRVSNSGGSDLVVSIGLGLAPPDSTPVANKAIDGPPVFELASHTARRETPGDPGSPSGSPTPTGPGPEINLSPPAPPAGALLGSYSGDHLAFGISDFGEIMPFQFPPGNEHLAVGGFVSGYTLGYFVDSTLRVFWSGYSTRSGIVPISYQELSNTPVQVTVRVTTETVDGILRIIRDFEFLRVERFLRVSTRLENVSGRPVTGAVYKEFTDWDVDGDFADDSWNYDRGRGMSFAWEGRYTGLAAHRLPDVMDIHGWGDYFTYDTFVDFPVGPIHFLDGMALLHFNQGTLDPGNSVSAGVIYGAGNTLAELQNAVDRAHTRWLTVSPIDFTVPAGGHADVAVQLDATGLAGDDYQAAIEILSNDPVRNQVQVPTLLRVTGVPDLRVEPDALDFGSLFIGLATAETLEVRNLGSDALEVTAVSTSSPVFGSDPSGFVIEPGASRFLIFTFQPDSPAEFTGTGEIHSNDPDQPILSIPLSGTGLTPPDISVSPESLAVTLIRGATSHHTLTVANHGGSDLVAAVLIADLPGDSTGAIQVFPPAGASRATSTPSGPEANSVSQVGPARTMAGSYTGARMSFGVSDLGEIMPYQSPVGAEHLAVSTQLSGYTVGTFTGSQAVYVAGYDYRSGIEPESFQELAVTPAVVSLRVRTRTANGQLRIIRDITFRRSDTFIHVATTIENLTSTPVLGVVFKEFADFDVDGGTGADSWTREPTKNMVYAWDTRYVGLAGKDPPSLMDIYGWLDYRSYPTTVENFPIDPTPVDGMALLHYSIGSLGSRAKETRSVAYCAGTTRIELFAAADRAGASPPWINASPNNLVLAPGQAGAVAVNIDTEALGAGEHRAVVRFQSNDPDQENLDVPVRLTVVLLPDIAAAPTDFGAVYVGQSRSESVLLRNEGAIPLTILGMVTNGDFAVEGSTASEIPPGGTLSVSVRFTPTSGCAPCSGALTVTSNDPDENPYSVPLTGIGVVPPQLEVGTSPVVAALAPALGPPATTGARELDIANSGGSTLGVRAIPIEVTIPSGARVLAVGPSAALGSDPNGPRSTGGGPDAAGYSWIASNELGGPVFEWADIALGANRLPLVGNDNVQAGVSIGFEFPFYGETFNAVNVSTNGWLSFTSTLLPGAARFALPSADPGAPRNLIAPFWENLTFGSIQRAYAKGEPDRFVVSYIAVATLPITGAYTFQTILYPDGRIVFQYLNVPIPAASLGTVGIQNGDGTVGLTVSHGSPYLQRNFAIEFTPGVRWLRVVPGIFDVEIGETMPLGLMFDATGMADGDHLATIRLMTNDLETPMVDVPVTLHVGSIAAAFRVNLRCSRDDDDDDGGHGTLGGDDDDDDGGGGGGGHHDDDDDDGGGHDDDDDGGHHDDDDDGGHDDEDDDGPARFVRGVITLPVGYDPHDVVLSSIRAAGSVPVSTTKGPRIRGQKLKVWFNRAALLAALPDGDAVSVEVIGEIEGMTWFQGTASACVHRPMMAALAAEYHAGTPVALHWSDPPGMVPNAFDLWFSLDGGETWIPVALGMTSHATTWSVPNLATTEGMLGLVAIGPDGPTGSWRSEPFEIVGATADRLSARGAPPVFGLRLAGPNPSRDGPTLELALPIRQTVTVDVFDVRGARVRSYPAAEFEPGWHRVTWDGRGDDGRPLGAGVYFVRGTAGREQATVRVAVLK